MVYLLLVIFVDILSSDVFMGFCALIGILISLFGLFIVSSNIIKINKRVSVLNINSSNNRIIPILINSGAGEVNMELLYDCHITKIVEEKKYE